MYACIRENQCKLCRGPVSDSYHNQTWQYLRLLYPSMSCCYEWQRPAHTHSDSDIADGHVTPEEEGFIGDLSFSKDGRKLLAASSNGNAYLFDPNVQRFAACVDISNDPTLKVLFIDGANFVTASADNTIRLWDIRNVKQAINELRGHSNLIRSLDYDQELSTLISSSYDCNVRYWHLPSYQTQREDIDNEQTAHYRGIFFTCPDLNQVTISWPCKKMLCINSKGEIFMISNLDTAHLKADTRFAQFNSSLPLLLSWILPNTSTTRRNSLKMIDSNDYNIIPGSTVSKIHHLVTHPRQPVALIRFSSTSFTQFGKKIRDLTTIYKLDQLYTVTDISKLDTVRAYGTDVVEENLLYMCEQVRYRTMFEKKPSLSAYGRVVASPDKNGVNLLSFSHKLDMPLHTESANIFLEGSSFLTNEPNNMVTVATIARETDAVMCTKFSEIGLLLAVGETEGKVSFHQPKL